MNDARRKRLRAMLEQLATLRDEVDQIETEERDAFDAMPESLQQGERGQQLEENAEALSEAVGYVDEATGKIEEVL